MVRLAVFTLFISAVATLIVVFLTLGIDFWMLNKNKRIGSALLLISQVFTATPPTVIGVFFYYFCTQFDALTGLLFTPGGMILGQVLLGFPIAYFLFSERITQSFGKLLGFGLSTIDGQRQLHRWTVIKIIIADIRLSIVPTSFVVFSRLVGEVGAILIIGGSIYGKTDTLSTTIVVQTQMGDIESALLSGVTLLSIVIVIRLIIFVFERRTLS